MGLIDRQYLKAPSYGGRRTTAWLNRQGYAVKRTRVRRPMQLMGIETIYQRPNTGWTAHSRTGSGRGWARSSGECAGLVSAMVFLIFFLAVSSTAYGGEDEDLRFEARLNGAQEVPSVDTDTTGKVEMRFNKGLTEAEYRLKVRDGVAVTQAHLHCARTGRNGPVVAFVFGLVPGGFHVDGELAEFTLTDANITGVGADCVPITGLPIDTIADLADAIMDDNIYADVHTIANPHGEIRGQLELD